MPFARLLGNALDAHRRFPARFAQHERAKRSATYGDLVIVRQTSTADNGDIVVALIDNGEVTLKRLRKHGARVELIPANQNLASMIYPAERVQIQGVVVGQVRIY